MSPAGRGWGMGRDREPLPSPVGSQRVTPGASSVSLPSTQTTDDTRSADPVPSSQAPVPPAREPYYGLIDSDSLQVFHSH